MIGIVAALTGTAGILARSEGLEAIARLLDLDHPDPAAVEARIHGLLALRDAVLGGEGVDALLALAEDCGEAPEGCWDDLDAEALDALRHARVYRLHSCVLAQVDGVLTGEDRSDAGPWPADDDGCGVAVIEHAVDVADEVARVRGLVEALRVDAAVARGLAGKGVRS